MFVSEAPECVAESYPAFEPPPVKAFGVHWLFVPAVALPALILPRRMGPYLAASNLRAAYVAHFLGVAALVAVYLLAPYMSAPMQETSLSWSETVRTPLAELTLLVMDNPMVRPFLVQFVIVIGIGEGLIWLAAMACMPWIAAGEPSRRVYLRSMKLLLWSTLSCLVLLVMMYAVVRWTDVYWMSDESAITCGALWLLWWIWILLRWGDRYGGPAEGPSFEPRSVRCEQCGYPLIHLPTTGRCPECGRAVADSLPGRREAPVFARARGWRRRGAAFFATLWAALRVQRFGERLAVHGGRRMARRFAVRVCSLIGLVALALCPLYWPDSDAADLHYEVVDDPVLFHVTQCAVLIVTTWAMGALAGAATLVAGGLLVTWGGWREPARRGLLTCYGAGWLVIPAVLVVAAVWSCVGLEKTKWFKGQVQLPVVGPIDVVLLIVMALFVPALTALGLWLFQLRRLLRATRFANA